MTSESLPIVEKWTVDFIHPASKTCPNKNGPQSTGSVLTATKGTAEKLMRDTTPPKCSSCGQSYKPLLVPLK